MSKRKVEDFDAEPVVYCPRCYSLNIVYEDAIRADCCGDCGCSDVKTSTIDIWEKLYQKRYGHKFVERSNNVRDSFIFQMSTERLKTMLFKDPSWREICKTLYPTFPGGLSKADSVILLFAKLCQENRLDDLRMELLKRNKE